MIGCLLLLLTAVVSAQPSAEEPSASTPNSAASEASVFDETPSLLVPKQPRSQSEKYRLISTAYYAEARLLQRREQYDAALRRLQRAWRYYPQSEDLLPQIIFLANSMRRIDDTVRYTLIAAEKGQVDTLVLRRLAIRLSGQQRWADAKRVYEILLDQSPIHAKGAEPEVGEALMYFDIGRVCFLLQEYDEAAKYFRRIQRFVENPEQLSDNATLQEMLLGEAGSTYQLLAETYLNAGETELAGKMFRKANEVEKNDARLEFQLARVAAKLNRNDEALQRLEKYLKTQSNDLDAYQLLAELFVRMHGESADEKLLARLEPLGNAPDAKAAVLQFLGDWHRQKERWKEAESRYQAALKAGGADAILKGLAEVYLHQRDVAKLLDTLGSAAADGSLLQDMQGLRERLVEDSKLIDELLAETTRRLKNSEQEVALSGVPMAAADLAVAVERFDEAEPLFELALQWKEPEVRARALLGWAIAMIIAEQNPRAAKLLQHGIDEDLLGDRTDVGYYYLVRSLAWDGRYEEALQAAEVAAKQFPESLRILSLPAWALYAAKDYAAAEARYRAILKKFDDAYDNEAVREEMKDIRLILSNLCVQTERMEEGEEWLEQVLDEFPRDVGASNDLGYLWADQGKRLDWALQLIQHAVDAEPDNAAYLDSLGWVYYRLKRYDQAVKELEKATAGEDPDGVVLEHLGDAYAAANRANDAVRTWKRAVEQFDEDDDATKRAATLEKIRMMTESGEKN